MTVDRNRALKRFGRSLAQLRKESGLTQEALANRSNLHPTYIGGLERGVRNPTVLTVLSLAKGLGVAPSELLDRPFG